MIQRLLNFIKKPTSKNILINTIGNYFNIIFVAFFAFLLVRIMNPDQYGVLSVLLGISYVLANILDFGTTASIYSYLPPMIEKKHKNTYIFLKTTFTYQTVFSAVVITLLLVFFPYLDRVFFKTGAPWWELYLTTFSVLFFVWQNFIINSLNAAKRFFQANLLLNLSNIVKTVLILVLIPLHLVSVGSIIFAFGIFGPMIFFLFLLFDKRHIVKKVLVAQVISREFRFGYTLTFFIASQFFNLSLRMDLFLLSFFLSKSPEVGYYGLSQKIILTIIASVASITQVLSPNFSRIGTKREVFKEFRHGLLYLMIPVAMLLFLRFLPNQIFYFFFTEKYAKTAEITKSLSLPFILYTIIQLPSLFLLYTAKKPIIHLVVNLILLIIVTVGCYFYIPRYGVFAPTYVFFAGFGVVMLISFYWSYLEYKKLPNKTT